jgi:hypothetical protein
MSLFPNISLVFLETIIGPMVPWFLAAAGGDRELARHTVLTMLASYNVHTEQEIRLAAEITIFSCGTLAALGKSADPDLPLNVVLRLRGSANALQRSKHQCQFVLDRLRKERMAVPASQSEPPAPEPPAQQPVTAEVPRPALPVPAFALSRQQRRALERAMEKRQRQQAEQVRRDTMRAMRAASNPPAMIASQRTNQSPAAGSDLVAAHHS